MVQNSLRSKIGRFCTDADGSASVKIAKIVPGTLGFECGPSRLADPNFQNQGGLRLGSMNDIF
jgi:hypothetical protein